MSVLSLLPMRAWEWCFPPIHGVLHLLCSLLWAKWSSKATRNNPTIATWSPLVATMWDFQLIFGENRSLVLWPAMRHSRCRCLIIIYSFRALMSMPRTWSRVNLPLPWSAWTMWHGKLLRASGLQMLSPEAGSGWNPHFCEHGSCAMLWATADFVPMPQSALHADYVKRRARCTT